jgi:hypothetical protein
MRRYIGILATASVVLLLGLGVQPGQVHLEPRPDTPKSGANRSALGRILAKHKAPPDRQKWSLGR